MHEASVAGFLPSRDGFHFANRWPPTPAFWLGAGYLRLGIGNVADGLCGGMCFVVRDRFEAGQPISGLTAPPPAGTPLFAEIVRRQVDSFDRLLLLPLRFWAMAALQGGRPGRHGGLLGRLLGLRPRDVATVRDEWPRIRSEIDAGRLAMVGLVRRAGINPLRLGGNHQVMAWGYRVAGDSLAIRIYDPNWPDRDDVELRVDLDRDGLGRRRRVGLAQSTGEPLLAFLAAPYRPPGRSAGATRSGAGLSPGS